MFLEYPVNCGLVSQMRLKLLRFAGKLCSQLKTELPAVRIILVFKAHSDKFIAICVLTLGVLFKIL